MYAMTYTMTWPGGVQDSDLPFPDKYCTGLVNPEEWKAWLTYTGKSAPRTCNRVPTLLPFRLRYRILMSNPKKTFWVGPKTAQYSSIPAIYTLGV